MPLKVKKVTGPTIAASVLFNGSNQYLSIASNSAFNFGTGNYTVEGWFYWTSVPANARPFTNGQSAGSFQFYWDGGTYTSNKLTISNRIANQLQVSFLPVVNTWYHIAAVRNSGTVSIYVNGTSLGSIADSNNYSTSAVFNIGGDVGNGGTWFFPGYISNVRVVSGTAVYTSNFTPSTSPLTAIANTSILTCHDTTIRDASTNNFTITNNNTATVSSVAPFTAVLPSSMKFKKTSTGAAGRSVQFDGVNDYLSLSNSAAFNFGTGDLTIEFWIYFTGTNQSRVITSRMTTGGASGTWSVTMNNTYLSFTEVVSGEPGPSAAFSSILNTWAHIAVSRNSGTTKLFLNGSQIASAAQTKNFSNTSYPVYIATSPSESFIPAYISNLRVLKGTGLYTASFSVPTSPLTAIANTSLLTCNAATIIDGSSNNFTITNNNGATVSSVVVPFTPMVGGFKVIKPRGVYMIATGGDLVTTSGSYKVHTFTTVGTSSFVVSSLGSTPIIECLLVGGGGGGGGRAMGGGGGGGGVVYTSSALLTTGSFSAIVGAGGIAATGMQASSGQNGGNTLFTYNSITTTVLGGGGGATEGYVGLNGANGGGGTNGNGAGGAGIGGGFPGGSGSAENYLTRGCGGGGGGAGGAGVRGVQGIGGNGGIGAIYNITGSAYYGGGGGGGGQTNAGGATAGAGGLGGGGLGGRTSPGTAGTANTGGGGGGGGYTNTTGASETNGGNGGSGIILIKYRYTD